MRRNKKIDEKVGLISKRDLRDPKSRVIYWGILLLLWIGVLTCLVPAVWLLTSAFKDVEEILRIPPTIIPRSFNPDKLVKAWKQFDFSKFYFNTISLAGFNIIVGTITNGLVAYSLSRIKPAGSKIMMGIIFAGFFMPPMISLVPGYMFWMDVPLLHMNFLDTYVPLMVGAFVAGGMNVLIYKVFFDNIPTSLLEAAKLDGCTEFGIFFRIVMPLCKSIIITKIVLEFNGIWGDFFGPYLYLRSRENWTVMVYVYRLSGLPINERMFLLTFAMIPPMIVYFIFHKRIMNGFTLSGVKE